jgi:FAD/FMN-containing dehydrogenase
LCGVRGTVSADRGIGTQKKELSKELFATKNQGNYSFIHFDGSDRKGVDPYNIFNPGKMV